MEEEKDFKKKVDTMSKNWEKKGEEFGKKAEKKIEKSRIPKIIGYAIAVIINLVILWILSKLPDWDFKFLTENYIDVLSIVKLSLFVGIGGNVLLIIYNVFWFKRVIQIIMNIVSFIAALAIYRVFPFDFAAINQNWLTISLKIFLIVVMVGIAIGTIVEFVKLITSKKNQEEICG